MDPELIAIMSAIPLGDDKWFVRADLYEDGPAFRGFLKMYEFSDYKLLIRLAYLGVENGDVIIRGLR